MAKNERVKKFIIWGTIIFGVSSLMCALSTNFWMLVAFRLVQGVAAAMMSSALPSIIVHMLPVDRKGLGMSVMGASSGIALIAGPVLGGFLTSAFSWHAVFIINVPICLVIVALAAKHLPSDGTPDRSKDPTRLGGLSAMIFIGSVLTILEDLGDPDLNTIGKIVCGILMVISLITLIISTRRDVNKAIIAPKMLFNSEYFLVGMSFLLCTIVVAGANYLLPYLLQEYWGMSPMRSSLYLTAISVAMVTTVLPVGGLCDRYGCKGPVMVAIIMRSLFFILMIVMVAEDVEPIMLLIPMIAFGVSHAFSGTAQPTRMIHHATPGYEDEATNFMLVVNYVASALGCVLFALVYSITSGTDVHTEYLPALAEGFTGTMWFSLILLLGAMICTLVVKNKIVKKE
jgi:MFS family permease